MSKPEAEPEPEQQVVTCRLCGAQALAKLNQIPDGWWVSLRGAVWCGPCRDSWEANST